MKTFRRTDVKEVQADRYCNLDFIAKMPTFLEFRTVQGQSSSIGSVLGSQSSMMQHCGFDPPQVLPVEGIFSLGVNMGSDSIP